MPAHALVAVETEGHWRALHAIRRQVLFTADRHGKEVVYDKNHPDDRRDGNQPFLLMLDGFPIGTCRLDRRGTDEGVVRLVAIAADRQRQGHGRALSDLVDAEARRRGMVRLDVNAIGTAIGFYERTGWRQEAWDPAELRGIAQACVQMVKVLDPPR